MVTVYYHGSVYYTQDVGVHALLFRAAPACHTLWPVRPPVTRAFNSTHAGMSLWL